MATVPPASVPANDFARQWADVRADALAAIERVGESGWLVLGEEVASFEREFANWWGAEHAVAVASGLDALEIALRCAGLTPGDRVMTTPLTAFATTLAITRAGGEPVFVDVDDTGSLDLALADAALMADPSIRFVLPVHLYGHPLDPHALRDVTERHGVMVIEDCAQSAGASRDGGPTGLVGLAAGVSLYPTKNLGAMGDGGVLLTADGAVAERARVLRNYGQTRHYEHNELGLNSRLDELQAALLRSALLPRLDGWLARRRELARQYEQALTPLADTVRVIAAAGGTSAHHLFPLEAIHGDAELLREGMRARGVAVGRHYPILCPDQLAMRARAVVIGDLTEARRIADSQLSLPINPYLSDDDLERVVEVCFEVCM